MAGLFPAVSVCEKNSLACCANLILTDVRRRPTWPGAIQSFTVVLGRFLAKPPKEPTMFNAN